MELPLNAHVFCEDEFCGHSRFVVINPQTQQLTHFVIQTNDLIDPIELVVPIGWIERADSHMIQLDHPRDELLKLPMLQNLDTLGIWDPEMGYFPHHAVLWPISLSRIPQYGLTFPGGGNF